MRWAILPLTHTTPRVDFASQNSVIFKIYRQLNNEWLVLALSSLLIRIMSLWIRAQGRGIKSTGERRTSVRVHTRAVANAIP